MKRIMISAMNSGSGKTVLTCGLLAALKARGQQVQSFKCGPDYIDPMFHTRVLGVPSRNLDVFLQGEDGVKRTLAKQTAPIAIIEGAMGLFDGVGSTHEASAWHVANVANCPVVLAVHPKGSSLTLAAQIKGMIEFRQPHLVAGVVLTNCKPSMHMLLAPIIQAECGIPCLGYVPPMQEAQFESRHLGLMTAGEIDDLSERMQAIGAQVQQTVDIDALLALAQEQPDGHMQAAQNDAAPSPTCTIAVAYDEAFCFYYQDNFDELQAAGAQLAFFSPLHDQHLPAAVDGLYIGGGYPELYARELAANQPMLDSMRRAIADGMPTVAECGGFMSLQQQVQDPQGQEWQAVGALPGSAFMTDRLQRFGYNFVSSDTDNMLVRAGERIPAHEFHYWDCTDNGQDMTATKPSGRSWAFGFAGPNLYAGFPHMHFGGEFPLAQRFVEQASAYHEGRLR